MTEFAAPDPAELDEDDLDAYGELTDEQLAAIFEDLHGPQPGIEPADGDPFARDPEGDDEPDEGDQNDEPPPPAVVNVPTWGLL